MSPRVRRLILLAFVAFILISWCRSRWRGKLEGDPWRAGLDRYDYLESFTFTSDGKGDMVHGWDQAVRLEVFFRWETKGHDVEIEYTGGDVKSGEKTIGFSIHKG